MFNPIAKKWEQIYAKLPEDVMKQINEMLAACGRDFNKWQLKVIKKTRKFSQKGDVFLYSPRDNVYFYGVVINENINSMQGEGLYVVALFKDKTKSLDLVNFIPKSDNLICPPFIVSRLYWTKGFFFNIGHIDDLDLDIDYGFYDTFTETYLDEYGNKLKHEPTHVKPYGVSTDIGIAQYINRELIIHKKLLEFNT